MSTESSAVRSVPEVEQPCNIDLESARRQLCDIAVMAMRAAVSDDPREVIVALAVLDRVAA
jgi:hypothetical protein